METFPRAHGWLASALCLGACGDNLTHPVGAASYEAPAPVAMTCVPNLDGQITADELSPALGIPVSYLASPASEARTIDPIGAVDRAGHRVWDFTAPDVDPVVSIAAAPLAERWYADAFPNDAFAVALDLGQTLDGVYRHDGTALTLLGIASHAADPPEGQTLWHYDAPVVLYRFPLVDGATWTSVGEVRNGLVRGLPYAGRDTYTIAVDGTGRLALPDLTFSQVLRVRNTLVAQPAVGQSATRRQISWLFECFGEVARATAMPGETDEDFTLAAEVRRLGL
jgi:hypothetical protein